MKEFGELFMNDADFFTNTIGGTLAVIVVVATILAVIKAMKYTDY